MQVTEGALSGETCKEVGSRIGQGETLGKGGEVQEDSSLGVIPLGLMEHLLKDQVCSTQRQGGRTAFPHINW